MIALLFLCACSQKSSYTVTFGGDIMLARGGEAIIENWEDLGLSLPKDLSGDSVGSNHFYVANLESPLTDEVKRLSELANEEMNLCAGSGFTAPLISAGFDLLTTSNNHQDDCLEGGILQTNQLLTSQGLLTLEEVYGTWMKRIPEVPLVFIGVNKFAGQLDREHILEQIRIQKEKGNFVVISVHWGNEYQAGPENLQKQLAQDWVDAGVDVVWGHHPHVLQPMEWLNSSNDGHQALVIYSLGNLVFDQHMLPDSQRSALVQIRIRDNRIQRIIVAPVTFDWANLRLDFTLEQGEYNKIIDRLKAEPLTSTGIDVRFYDPR